MVRMAHSPGSGYGSAQRSASLADGSATVQEAARASHEVPSASRRLSNGHGRRSARDHMQRERSQDRSHHSSSRDRSLNLRGKQSTGRGRRDDGPYSPSRAARRPRRQSDSREKSPGEEGSASRVASILQLLSAGTLQSIRKCVARPMPLSNLATRMQTGLAAC